MLDKLLVFGLGYFMGAQGGRARLEEVLGVGRTLLGRDEFKVVVGLVQGLVEGSLGAEDRLAA